MRPFAVFGRGLAKVVQQRAGGANGLRVAGEAQPFEAVNAELLGENPLAVAGAENPLFEPRLDAFRAARSAPACRSRRACLRK